MTVDADAAAERGGPIGSPTFVKGRANALGLARRDKPVLQPVPDGFFVGIVNADEAVETAAGVAGDDAERPDRRPRITLEALTAHRLQTQVQRVGTDESFTIEQVKLAFGFEDDHTRSADGQRFAAGSNPGTAEGSPQAQAHGERGTDHGDRAERRPGAKA